jgi:hypothetical protein
MARCCLIRMCRYVEYLHARVRPALARVVGALEEQRPRDLAGFLAGLTGQLAVLGIRDSRNCFWGPRDILYTNPLYKKYSWPPDNIIGASNRERRQPVGPLGGRRPAPNGESSELDSARQSADPTPSAIPRAREPAPPAATAAEPTPGARPEPRARKLALSVARPWDSSPQKLFLGPQEYSLYALCESI